MQTITITILLYLLISVNSATIPLRKYNNRARWLIYPQEGNIYLDRNQNQYPIVAPPNTNSQMWWVEQTGDGWVYIYTDKTQLFLDSNFFGEVYLMSQNGGHHQHWRIFKYYSYRNIPYYVIQNRATKRYLNGARKNKRVSTSQGKGLVTRWMFRSI